MIAYLIPQRKLLDLTEVTPRCLTNVCLGLKFGEILKLERNSFPPHFTDEKKSDQKLSHVTKQYIPLLTEKEKKSALKGITSKRAWLLSLQSLPAFNRLSAQRGPLREGRGESGSVCQGHRLSWVRAKVDREGGDTSRPGLQFQPGTSATGWDAIYFYTRSGERQFCDYYFSKPEKKNLLVKLNCSIKL